MRQPTEQDFLKDVASHQMRVAFDNGVYRHLRFSKPDSGDMSFHLITYPSHLVYSGDMGCYVFSRLPDMFQFFREKNDGALKINPSYWCEKLEATSTTGGHKEYDQDKFERKVRQYMDDIEADSELRSEIESEVLQLHDSEFFAYKALHDFEYKDRAIFENAFEWNFEEYTFHFVWCCYAIVWGIRLYDRAQKTKA